MARRGLLAELQHQNRLAAQQRERAQRAAVREHAAAVRHAEQARKANARAQAQLGRAAVADRKRLEKEARDAHIASMEADAEERNLGLAETYGEIDSLLAATLKVDDFVDLETLRVVAEHPAFDRVDLEAAVPPPEAIPEPDEPLFTPPPTPTGFSGIFGKKKHAEAVAQAQVAHAAAVEAWREACAELPARREAAAAEHAKNEQLRVAALESERARYATECEVREKAATDHNASVDALLTGLGYGTVDAVQEYLGIVLSNSVYPEAFSVEHEFTYDPGSAELRLRALVPGPDKVPDVKSYKFSKAGDEIVSTSLPQKACKDRYSSAVEQVALRSLHEVFEADRRGLIKTISLEVGTNTTDPATGHPIYVPFVAASAERNSFLDFDLAAVVPAATLGHLGAVVSKNPLGLVAADTSGIRRL